MKSKEFKKEKRILALNYSLTIYKTMRVRAFIYFVLERTPVENLATHIDRNEHTP